MNEQQQICEQLLSKEYFPSLVTTEVVILIVFLILIMIIKRNKFFSFIVSLAFIAALLLPALAAIFKGQEWMEEICDIII